MSGPVRILVSSCLLGEKVRYDGGHKRDPFLVDTLGQFVEYVPVCPEVECGLPTPREAMHLVGNPADPHLVAIKTDADCTGRMKRWAHGKLSELEGLELCGYICKKGSPSSGMERVPVYGGSGIPSRVGAGMFTKAFMERFPLIPVEEEGRLRNPDLRERFVVRMFTLRRFRDAIRRGRARGTLVEFHTSHKLLLLAHGRPLYAEMGKLVARAKELPLEELYRRYQRLLLEALRRRATPARCADALLHAMGYLRPLLSPDEKRELLEAIEQHRNRLTPLVVPVTLTRHYARKFDVVYLNRQAFLNPHPVERMLQNHV
ncbi:MAG: DUF1722 domain-containing protein [Deltaproteobacteria bacterium]|nr:DUF1722 domain-containing protein [Deltaproteobacteria bacterium]PWB67985.1 MAG: DUF1722 domain-containing protein [Deltaproteobacteria bacterium]